MGTFIDLTGQRFGHLTVIRKNNERSKYGKTYWTCQCDCGSEIAVVVASLRSGKTQSCGCKRRRVTTEKNMKHGGSHTRLYKEWRSMKERCYRPAHPFYFIYGGRGITVCEEWLNDFGAFQTWALANGYRDDLTIDRKDFNGPYSPANCRWATMETQANNRRNSIRVEYCGNSVTLKEISKATGIPYSTVYFYYRRGQLTEMLAKKNKEG